VSLEALRPGGGKPAADWSDTISPLPPWLTWTFLALAAMKLALVAVIPVQAWTHASYDDALFVRSAVQLSAGHWLGPYDQLTLVKGPMYPMFISLCHTIGLPLKLGEHLVYTIFCLVLIRALRPLVARPPVLLVLFTVVLFDPVWMINEAYRTTRAYFYAGLTGLVLACALAVALRRHLPLRWTYLWAVGLGLSLSCFWLTREEGIWVVPSLLLLFAWAGWTVLRHHPQPVRWFLACLVPAAILLAGYSTVCVINGVKYGVYNVSEFKNAEFLAAYGALGRIKPAEWQRQVPIPKEVRMRAYAVSPAFRELRPVIEGPLGQAFARYSAEAAPDQDLKGEIGGGHMLWVIREAAAQAGHAKSGTEARQFYARLAGEIDDACDRGDLAAGPRRDSLIPPLNSSCLAQIPISLIQAACTLFCLQGLDFKVTPSVGDEHALALFREMTHGTLSPVDPPTMRVTGWAFSPTTAIDLLVRSSGSGFVPCTVSWSDSPDFYLALRNGGHEFSRALRAKFVVEFPETQGAELVVRGNRDLTLATIPLDGQHGRVDSESLQFWLMSIQPDDVIRTELKAPRMRVLRAIGRIYQAVMPPVAVMALVAFLGQCVGLYRGKRDPAFMTECVLLTAVAGRLAVNAIVDALAFPATGFHYLSPSHPLLVVFCVLAIWRAMPLVRLLAERAHGSWKARAARTPD
jgi:hypothetical protein